MIVIWKRWHRTHGIISCSESSTMSAALPLELWLQILRWATISPSTRRLYATAYYPFETASISIHDSATPTKAVLARVCRQWRRITSEFLYEDVWVKDAEGFQDALDHSKVDDVKGFGRWVRRMSLPYSSSATPTTRPIAALCILKQCPQLEILVRVESPRTLAEEPAARYEFPAACPPLGSIKRLDWWHHSNA